MNTTAFIVKYKYRDAEGYNAVYTSGIIYLANTAHEVEQTCTRIFNKSFPDDYLISVNVEEAPIIDLRK